MFLKNLLLLVDGECHIGSRRSLLSLLDSRSSSKSSLLFKPGSVPFDALPSDVRSIVSDCLKSVDSVFVIHCYGQFYVLARIWASYTRSSDFFFCGAYLAGEV